MTPELMIAISNEIRRSKALHPDFALGTRDPERSMCILGEEFGEATQAMLDMTRNRHNKDKSRELLLTLWQTEMIQVIAVSMQICDSIEKEIDLWIGQQKMSSTEAK